MKCYQKLALITLLFSGVSTVHGQSVQASIRRLGGGAAQTTHQSPPITSAATGKPVTMEEYSQLTKADPLAWHLVPQYDQYGVPEAYVLRAATPEERATQRFRDRDPAKQPKVGQPIASFAMTGMDGKTYQSADLTNNVVILSFWISLDKPFWSSKEADAFADALQSLKAQANPVVLGVLNSEAPKASEEVNLKNLPFVAVPNAYGFHNKYHITTVPTIIVIDKSGRVAANLQGPGIFDRLKQVLGTLPN